MHLDRIALIALHTVDPPSLDPGRAVALLAAAGGRGALEVTVELEEAALAFLAYHFTPLGIAVVEGFEPAFEATGQVLRRASLATRQRFLELVLNCMYARDLMLLATLIEHAIPRAFLDATLCHHAALGNALHLHNVFWLHHYLGRSVGPMLFAVAEQLIARPGTNRCLREAAVVALRARELSVDAPTRHQR